MSPSSSRFVIERTAGSVAVVVALRSRQLLRAERRDDGLVAEPARDHELASRRVGLAADLHVTLSLASQSGVVRLPSQSHDVSLAAHVRRVGTIVPPWFS